MGKETITAPMPGVFYRRPNPDEDTFAEAGDSVEAGDTIALVGVMKNFHDITADADCTIVEFLVENEAEITAGEPLVEIEVE